MSPVGVDPDRDRRYALFSLASKQARFGRLTTICLNPLTAERQADELCATLGYAAVVVKPYLSSDVIPDRIPAAEL